MNALVNILGWSGTVAVVAGYYLVTSGRVKGLSWTFQGLNTFAAVTLGWNNWYYHALPNLGLDLVLFGIGTYGLLKLLTGRTKER